MVKHTLIYLGLHTIPNTWIWIRLYDKLVILILVRRGLSPQTSWLYLVLERFEGKYRGKIIEQKSRKK